MANDLLCRQTWTYHGAVANDKSDCLAESHALADAVCRAGVFLFRAKR